ncbi:MAG TPA: DUF4013 domain-containing protein [Rhodothermia bacterium]|nr:DUF4013 domain-containing protein [Rhodothermia bacterium]
MDGQEEGSVDFGQSFAYVFKDEEWFKKLSVGGLFVLLAMFIIGSFFVAGYELEVMRRVMRRDRRPLPQWDDLGRKLGEGFMLMVAFLVYAVPIMIVSTFSDGDGGVLAALMTLAFFLWVPAVQIQYARTSDFSACFRGAEIFQFVRSNLGTYVPAALLSILVWGLAFSFGWLAFIIGWPWVIFWGSLVSSHILGQVGTLWSGPAPRPAAPPADAPQGSAQ